MVAFVRLFPSWLILYLIRIIHFCSVLVTSDVEQKGYISRFLGMAMAPGAHVVKVLAMKDKVQEVR